MRLWTKFNLRRWLLKEEAMKTMAPKIVGPRAMAAPMHLHTREDEYSYVLEGRVGALCASPVSRCSDRT